MQRDGLLASLGPRPLSLSSRLLNRHPTQLARHAVSQPSFAPIKSQATEAPVDRVVAIPHILESIVAHSTRATQVTLLRVCHDFHRMAGKQIYRIIKINQRNFLDMMHGALIGTGSNGNVPTGCTEFAAEFLDILKPDILADLHKRFLEGSKVEDLAIDVVIGNKDHKYKPRVTNFKRSLFKHTEVLTVGTHHTCFCDLFRESLTTLFPNLRTLRIAPSKSERPFELAHTCDSLSPCPLLTNLKPRKIVVRNLDGGGLPIPDNYIWDVPDLETFVCFIPVDQREFNDGRIFLSLIPHFESAKSMKMVFYDKHEGPVGVDELLQRTVLGGMPVNPDIIMTLIGAGTSSHRYERSDFDGLPLDHHFGDFVSTLKSHRGTPDPAPRRRKCTVYGVGALNFDLSGSTFVPLYHRLFPSHAINRKKVVEIVKKEAMSEALFKASVYPWIPFDRAAWEKGQDFVTFKSITDYKKEKSARRAEINAED
ncbi:uncharacterized protein LOC62_01G001528 [Vanrija pseudolonga]|uniref:Uncharacterized protein n=1 Tax=Vanrija pseudolonga TaxID=143232 RepID=A0AAF0Y584_9TREE|nr:hypothetical protein LOC62_01G001528 [Vanrija pseudolonga]